MAKKCPMCGAPMDQPVCGYCGYREETSAEPQVHGGRRKKAAQPQVVQAQIVQPQLIRGYNVSAKSKTTTLVLCLLLGIFGGHYFYVGKTGMGLLYLVTCGLLGLGWLADIILIVSGNFKDKYGLPIL